jgi:hypothetical protein
VNSRRILEQEQRERLRHAFEDFEQVPFPAGSDDQTVDELRTELAEYDSWAAGLVSSLIGGAPPSQPVSFDAELEARLLAVVREGDAQSVADARRYLDYLGRWRELVELANKLEAEQRRS